MGQQVQPQSHYTAVLLTASAGTFLAMLDSTVVNLVIPSLGRDFLVSSAPTLSWVITAYAVLFAALLAPVGRLADVAGRRLVFISGVTLFTLMSVASALAPALPVLVAARAVQGVGAAAMVPSALAILLLDGPPGKRVASIGVWGASSAMAAALGPSVGGILVNSFGWRAVFFINLPLGVITLISAWRILPRQQKPVSRRGFPDPLGTLLLAAGIGAMTLGLTKGSTWHWGDARTLASLTGGAAATALALVRSSHVVTPAIDTGLWRNRTFATANIVAFLYGMVQYPWLLAGVLFLTNIWRYDELKAGLAISPGAFAASAAALGIGRFASRYGPRLPALLGLAGLAACGFWLVFGLTTHAAFLTLWLPAGILAGLGMGAATIGTSSAAALSAPATHFAAASGMNSTARQFGGALGIAIAAVTLGSAASQNLRAYERVYLYCTICLLLGLAIAWAGLRPAPRKTAALAPSGSGLAATGVASPAERDQPAATPGGISRSSAGRTTRPRRSG